MLARVLVALASAALSSSGPLTIPLTPEGSLSDVIPDHLRPVGKAFHLLSHVDRPLPTLSDVVQLDKLPTCNVTMQLEWSAHIGPMASAPLIIPSTEGKRIAIATLHEDIELLDAGGRRIPGWPVRYPGSRFFGSPMLLDVDQDGTPEVVAADDQGNVFFMRSNGEYLEDYHIQLPKLRVRRDWVELTRNPGSGTGTDGSGTEPMISLFDSFQLDGQGAPQAKKKGVQDPLYVPSSEGVQGGGATDSGRRRLSEEVENEEVLEDVQLPEHWDAEEEDRGFFIDHSHDLDHDPESEGLAEGQGYGYGTAGTVRHANDDMGAYAYGYMSRMRRGHHGQGLTEEEQGMFISLDPHLLAAPVLYLDGTSPLLLFPVSYYLNEEVAGVDRSLYFASALLCWEVLGEYYKYTAHLDLSTNHTPTHRAELLSTPQVVDLDGDGTVEVLVHTSLGVLYVLDSDGRPRRQTQAMQTHATQTRLLAVDLTGGQSLEVIAADAEGSVLALTTSLEVLWDEQPELPCPVHITPSVVDIDDDGVLDVLVAVTCGDRGLVYALGGDSGRTLRRWALPRPVSATITTALLGNRLYLFIPTYDGHVYIVSAEGVCAQSLDAGTSSYTPVLLADITSSGVLDILTTSLSGDIALYSTPYEVPSSARGLAGHVGVVLSAREKARLRHLATAQAVNISLHFHLLDGRPPRNLSALHPNARYMVTISRQSAGTPEEVLFSESYRHAGSYTASISLPGPSDNLLVVRVVDEHLLGGEDSLPVQVSAEFHAWIKYFVAGPVVLFCSIVYLKISSTSSSSS